MLAFSMHMKIWFVLQVLAVFCLTGLVQGGESEALKFGVLSNKGAADAFSRWAPLAQYLSSDLGRKVEIVPLNFGQLREAVDQNELDLLITNQNQFVQFRDNAGLTPLVTMARQGSPFMGGVIFALKDGPVDSVRQLKGKRITAVSRDSMGGYVLQAYQMLGEGIDVSRDASLKFLDNQDHVVYAVLNGAADAGFVRTDQIEGMARLGKVEIGRFRILNQTSHKDFPYLCSTSLVPEWPVCATRRVPAGLGAQIARSLAALPADSPALKAAKLSGFVAPGDYTICATALKALKIQ